MNYNYVKDTMTEGGKEYPLGPYRKWLIQNYEPMVQGSFIKSIHSVDRHGRPVLKQTFDWSTIYFKAEEYGILKDYLCHIYKS